MCWQAAHRHASRENTRVSVLREMEGDQREKTTQQSATAAVSKLLFSKTHFIVPPLVFLHPGPLLSNFSPLTLFLYIDNWQPVATGSLTLYSADTTFYRDSNQSQVFKIEVVSL